MKILIADDHGLFRDSLSLWLEKLKEPIEPLFACQKSEVLLLLKESPPLMLLDLHMPGMEGVISIAEMSKQFPNTRIIIVSAEENPTTVKTCLQAGAMAYVTKSSSGSEILKAIEQVQAGHQFLSKNINLKSLNPNNQLNKQHMILLFHLCKGLKNKKIAEKMNLSIGTIKQYVSEILRELDVDNRTQATVVGRKILGLE